MRYLLIALLLVGCTHSIHLVNTSDFEPFTSYGGGKLIQAKSEQFVIYYMTGNTDYVEEAYHKLMKECPGGTIKGITTQYSTSHGFFSWTNKILMQGLCVSKG
ncbi:MAG: hypothetical protein HYR96_15285 [Deltaproteobacteria bacterium]|nr:hypothetical protein [Deltaproteobacteria bacterium]MBI3296243.1 hypothetical protein [Deltaproteobacteria bacterium]